MIKTLLTKKKKNLEKLLNKTIKKYSNNENIYNDISMLEETRININYYPNTIDDLINIIKDANLKKKKICMCGQKHSMGGHTLIKNGILIDLKNFNKMEMVSHFKDLNLILKKDNIFDYFKTDITGSQYFLKVQSGATWCDIMKYVNNYKKTPIVMQSYCNFSIGGSISVNAHGINNIHISDSIVCIKILNSNGDILTLSSNNKNNQLFRLVIGGYGLFGIILEIIIKLQPNYQYHAISEKITVDKFIEYYNNLVNKNDCKISARFNTNNLNDILILKFIKMEDKEALMIHNLNDKEELIKFKKFIFNFVLTNKFFLKYRNYIDFYNEIPYDFLYAFNKEYLTMNNINSVRTDYAIPFVRSVSTFILFEAFIPQKNFKEFCNNLSNLIKLMPTNIILINISIRVINGDKISFLSYCPNPVFALVFYFKINKKNDNILGKFTKKLINLILSLQGTFYLPYRFHYTGNQLRIAYPQIDQFMKLKKIYDPNELFSSNFYLRLKRKLSG